jgi:hypothetical protein
LRTTMDSARAYASERNSPPPDSQNHQSPTPYRRQVQPAGHAEAGVSALTVDQLESMIMTGISARQVLPADSVRLGLAFSRRSLAHRTCGSESVPDVTAGPAAPA